MLTKLTTLYLSSNYLSGAFPSTPAPPALTTCYVLPNDVQELPSPDILTDTGSLAGRCLRSGAPGRLSCTPWKLRAGPLTRTLNIYIGLHTEIAEPIQNLTDHTTYFEPNNTSTLNSTSFNYTFAVPPASTPYPSPPSPPNDEQAVRSSTSKAYSLWSNSGKGSVVEAALCAAVASVFIGFFLL
jgi:hypothetical protein